MQALMMKLMHKVKNAAIFLAQPQHSTAPYIVAQYALQNYRKPSFPMNLQQCNGPQTDCSKYQCYGSYAIAAILCL